MKELKKKLEKMANRGKRKPRIDTSEYKDEYMNRTYYDEYLNEAAIKETTRKLIKEELEKKEWKAEMRRYMKACITEDE